MMVVSTISVIFVTKCLLITIPKEVIIKNSTMKQNLWSLKKTRKFKLILESKRFIAAFQTSLDFQMTSAHGRKREFECDNCSKKHAKSFSLKEHIALKHKANFNE